MEFQPKSIRPFIGAKNYAVSRNFYQDLGFTEFVITPQMSLFDRNGFGFYLQDYYVEDWINNTMVFMEVNSVEKFWQELISLDLANKYLDSKIVPIVELDWGKECFVHDPSGNLWHFGEFK